METGESVTDKSLLRLWRTGGFLERFSADEDGDIDDIWICILYCIMKSLLTSAKPNIIPSEVRSLLGLRPKKYGFTHILRVLVKYCSCLPHQVALHCRLSDRQTWISIFKKSQSGYKPADLPDFTYLAQKFASALNLRPSS